MEELFHTRIVGILELITKRLSLAFGQRLHEPQCLVVVRIVDRMKGIVTHVLAGDGVDNIIRRGTK